MQERSTPANEAALNAQIDQQEAELQEANRKLKTAFIVFCTYAVVMLFTVWLQDQEPGVLTDLANALPFWLLTGVNLLCGAYFMVCLKKARQANERLYASRSLKRRLSGTN